MLKPPHGIHSALLGDTVMLEKGSGLSSWTAITSPRQPLNGSEITDYGDTIVVRLIRPGEQQIAVLAPRNVAADLASRLLCKIEVARRQRQSTTSSP